MWEAPVTKIVNFLRQEFGSQFAAYYDGDPDLIPDFNLPAISVVKLNDTTSNGSTGMQRVTETIIVKIILNKADDWDNMSDTTNTTEKRIRDLVEARDPETGRYKESTVKHALLNRLTMDAYEIDQNMTFELGILVRDVGDGEDFITTAEGHLTLTITYQVQNPRYFQQ